MTKTGTHRSRPQPEVAIRRAVKSYLEIGGWWVVPIVQSALSYKGIPDLVVMRAGRVAWIEVKTATGRLSAAQDAFRHYCQVEGIEHIVARSVDDVAELVDCLRPVVR